MTRLGRLIGMWLTAVVVPLITGGCGSGAGQFTPTQDEARTALEKALAAWSAGRACGSIEGTPPVQVVDSDWLAGGRIDSFEIGEEKDLGDGTRLFMVKLTRKSQKNASSVQEVRYVLHGHSPVYVFREEDYQRTLNMENNPQVPRLRTGRRGKA
jgi:hypothetical protein